VTIQPILCSAWEEQDSADLNTQMAHLKNGTFCTTREYFINAWVSQAQA
jgi:hypothetical protein